ncbi:MULTISPECIES: hypothetical protein [Rhodococcus erythropolis group]|nr:hypothetical protein [Rhodococcus erythropolis]MYV29448.1 hypothetical protein [Rhodococcus erythropolis]
MKQPRPAGRIIDSFVKAIARWDVENDARGCQPLLGLVVGCGSAARWW